MPGRHMVAWALLFLVSAPAKAAVDVLTHKAGANRLERLGVWFDARISWKFKYKDYDAGDLRPRFPGAKTWLVLLTDFWHSADAAYLLGWQVPIVLFLPVNLAAGAVLLCALKGGFGAVFELFYRRVFPLKPGEEND